MMFYEDPGTLVVREEEGGEAGQRLIITNDR
jgi:hypothetical protein